MGFLIPQLGSPAEINSTGISNGLDNAKIIRFYFITVLDMACFQLLLVRLINSQ